MPESSRSRKGLRALAATIGLGMVAAPIALVTTPAHAADNDVEVNLLGINDFHGRIQANGQEAGSAVLAGAVDQIRAEHPNTVFAAAGDLIGASTFESFINNDKPTIDALNEAGLEVSAAGNHEFDKGYDDLVNRVMAAESAENPDGGADWKYLSANLKMKDSGNPALDPSWVKSFGDVKVGFVGAVTEHLPELVSPAGIKDLEVTDIVDAVNAEADDLKTNEGVDLVVMLVHEGAADTECATMDDDPTSDFGSIVTGIDENVDAIISGHTHLAYNCEFPVKEWADEGRAVTERPVVSAGQYGYNLNQLTFQVDPATGEPSSVDTSLLPLTTCDDTCGTDKKVWRALYPSDENTEKIVAEAVADAEVKGAKPLGEISGGFKRAVKADGSENRGGESSLGNLVAEAQRWATRSETTGSAQIAFMNPGGLRADMLGNAEDGYPAVLTYKQAATVQPFANTLVNMDLTGAQIKTVLEQQWQPEGSSRPFLKLGVSKGFEYTYDPTAAKGEHITSMTLDGTPIEAGKTYSVTVNSFLASGGDNFTELDNGTNKQDTGQTDLQGMVDFMAQYTEASPLQVDRGQRAVGVTFPNGSAVAAGDTLSMDLSSLTMTAAPAEEQDDQVSVALGEQELGTFDVDNSVVSDTNDENGTASVEVAIPAGTPAGEKMLTITGDKTGTQVEVPVSVTGAQQSSTTVKVKTKPHHVVAKKTRVKVTVKVHSDEKATGTVTVKSGGRHYTAKLKNGKAKVRLKAYGHRGDKRVRAFYSDGDQTYKDVTTVHVVNKHKKHQK